MFGVHMPRHARITGVLYLLGVLAGCKESTGITVGPPARLLVVSGEAQSAPAGTQLSTPLVVKVTDEAGNPVPQQIVNFVVTGGGGSVFAPAAITNSDGTAQNLWTLGTSVTQPQTLEARAVDPSTGAPLVFATFHASVTAGVAAQVIKTAGDAQSGAMAATLADSLQVKVVDQYGNPVPNVTVTWAAGDGGAVSPATSTSRADGTTRTAWTLGNHASAVATASVASATPASFTATGTLNATMGVTVTKVSGDGQTGQVATTLPQPVVASVKLADGRPVVGVNVGFGLPGFPPDFHFVTGENGLASHIWDLGQTAGQQSLAVTADWLTSPVSFTATATAGPPAHVYVLGGSAVHGGLAPSQTSWVAGTAMVGSSGGAGTHMTPIDSIAALVEDQFGNPLGGVTVTWSTRGGAARPTAATTGADGKARTHYVGDLQQSWLFATVGALVDSNYAAPGVTYTSLAISPSPLTLAAGTTADLLIRVNDNNTGPIDVDSDYLTWTSSNSAVATVSTGPAGKPAHATVTAHAAGTATLTGSIGGMTGTVTVTVTP
jgi:protocatechuate 3,4-dioxygenase beta subunit